jgi:hypothetical protein
MTFQPRCAATMIGSVPHTDPESAVRLVLETLPDLPAWPQLPKRPGEGMIEQYAAMLPGLTTRGGKTWIAADAPDFEEQLTDFYALYLAAEEGDADALARFGLAPERAAGFHALIDALARGGVRPRAVKGHLTGPFTLGTTLVDQNKRCAFYDDRLRDAIVRGLAMNARWQLDALAPLADDVVLFVDEPSLAAFGSSAFVSVSARQIQEGLDGVCAAAAADHVRFGTHCCGNTDWSVLLTSSLDVVSFDSFGYFDRLLLYADDVVAFLERGGILAWGAVPSLDADALAAATRDSLLERLEEQMSRLADLGPGADRVRAQALITPSCGTGTLSKELAEKALRLTSELSAGLA